MFYFVHCIQTLHLEIVFFYILRLVLLCVHTWLGQYLYCYHYYYSLRSSKYKYSFIHLGPGVGGISVGVHKYRRVRICAGYWVRRKTLVLKSHARKNKYLYCNFTEDKSPYGRIYNQSTDAAVAYDFCYSTRRVATTWRIECIVPFLNHNDIFP